MGGCNDWKFCTPLGNIGSTSDETFCGALEVVLDSCLKKYKANKVLFVLTYDFYYDGESSKSLNSEGYTLKDYNDAILNACSKRNISVVSLEDELSWNLIENDNNRNVYTVDGLHLNEIGAKEVSEVIIKYIK